MLVAKLQSGPDRCCFDLVRVVSRLSAFGWRYAPQIFLEMGGKRTFTFRQLISGFGLLARTLQPIPSMSFHQLAPPR